MEGEKPKVNLYDGHYSDHMKEAQTKVRTYTYGENGARHRSAIFPRRLHSFLLSCV